VIRVALVVVVVAAAVVGAALLREPESALPPPPEPTNLPPLPEALHAATPAGVELGRRLFFDPRLSGNDTISCASCHAPALAFSDGVALSSHGASGKPLHRNAPSLANIAWAPALFWDGGSKNLESLVFGPITHPDEMGEDVDRLVAQLAADRSLRAAFVRAFPGTRSTNAVTAPHVMRALAMYMRSLVSAESRYDRWARGEGAALDAREQRGLAVHRARCASCHATDLFTDHRYYDIGLDDATALTGEDPRRGRARVTFDAADERAFRTPTLRNLRYTAPYMHDGRFATLDDVLDHYRDGIHATPTLAPALRDGLALTDDEARDLLAFLATLDDETFVRRHATGTDR
jgi:cytochrome c peroxidase